MSCQGIPPMALHATQTLEVTSDEDLIQLSSRLQLAADDYASCRENYHEISHQYHQSEQTYLKLKRQLSTKMQEMGIQAFVAGDSITVYLGESLPKCLVYDEQIIPSKFTIVNRVIDMNKLKKALLKDEIVSGAYLSSEGRDVFLKSKPKNG